MEYQILDIVMEYQILAILMEYQILAILIIILTLVQLSIAMIKIIIFIVEKPMKSTRVLIKQQIMQKQTSV